MIPRQPTSTLFPYTTLFRSIGLRERKRNLYDGALVQLTLRIKNDVGVADARKNLQKIFLQEEAVVGSDRSGHEQVARSEEHTSELQSRENLVCRLLLEKKKK